MADDENSIKVIFEADTSAVDTALKKTQSVAQKSARQISQQDKGSIKASGELIKNANKAVGIDTKLMKSGIKAAVLENKQFTTQKNQFKLQVGQHTRVGKLLTVQNKEQQKSLQLNSKLLKIDTNRYKTMKQLGSAWKSNQSAYAQMQAKRSTDAAAMQAHIGTRPPGVRPPQGSEEPESPRQKSEPIDWSKLIKPIAAAVRHVAQFVAQPMMEGYQKYVQFGRSVGRTIGQGGIGSIDYARAGELAFSEQETIEQAYGAARQTGHLGSVRTAQETSRFYGGSVDEAAGYMGTLTRAGSRFNETGGGAGRTQLFRMLRDATASGLDRSRVGEHLDAVAGAVEATGGRTAGDVDVSNISGLLSFIGASGRSGFQGARGMGVLQSIDAGFRSGGRDESSNARQLAAYGFGVPGQDTDYLTALLRQDQGIFGGEGTQGAENLSTMIRSYMASAHGNQDQAIVDANASGHFGDLGPNQIKALFETFNASGGNINTMAAAIDDLRETQGSVEEQIRDNLQTGQAEVADRIAKLDNRLLELGRQIFPAVAEIQDAVVRIQDALLPSAITTLDIIADGISTLVTFFTGRTAEQQAIDRAERQGSLYGITDENNVAQISAMARAHREYMQDIEDQEQEQWRISRANPSFMGIRRLEGQEAQERAEALQRQGEQLQNEYDTRIAPALARAQRVEAGLPPLPTPTTLGRNPDTVAPNVNVHTVVNVPAAEPSNARIPVGSGVRQ